MIRAVLFDFDGTLLNTNDLIFASYSHGFLRGLGRDITPEERISLYGRPLYDSLAVYGDKQDLIYQNYREFQLANSKRLTKKFPNTEEAVHMLRSNHILTGIVTSTRYDTMIKGIEFLGLDGCFDICITPADTQKHKPDPEPVLLACRRLNISPSEALMVGDSVFDLLCGSRAGAMTAGVKYSTTLDALLALEPDLMGEDLLDLARQVLSYNEREAHHE